jgi:undecaprenyl-diphosphatase
MALRDRPPPPRLRGPAALVLLALACAIFGALAADLVRQGPLTAADASITTWFQDNARPAATQVLLAITHLHSTPGVLLMAAVAALALLWRRQRQWAALLVLAVPGGMILNVLVKQAFQRARPQFDEPLVTLATYSFPSGHAASATLWWGFALIWLFAHDHRVPVRVLGTVVALALIVLTGLSRVYVGAHYLTDVLAAMAEGTAWLALCFTTLDRGAARGFGRR